MVGGLMFYLNDPGADVADMSTRHLRYDYCDVNKAILSRAPPTPDNRTAKIGESLYNNYLYQLFVVEFVNYLNNERNTGIRDRLQTLVKDTNFRRDVSAFRRELRDLLKDYPADFANVRDQMIAFYRSNFDKPHLLAHIESTAYDFDRVTLNKLKGLPRDELKKELADIATRFSVQRDFDTTSITFPNIYMPCGEMNEDTGYCDNAKLIVNRSIDEFVDILASDLTDNLKSRYLLNSVWTDTVVDYTRFSQLPSEVVTIYELP